MEKNLFQTFNLKIYGKTPTIPTDNLSRKTYTTDVYTTLQKQTTTCTNAQKKTTHTANTVDSQKTTYIYLQNVQGYNKAGHTTNQYSPN